MAFAAATLAARAASRRMAAWLAVFAFPTVLTSYEFLFSLISPNGTFWSLGYSQTDFLPFEQSSARDPMEVQTNNAGPGATFYTHYGDWFGWVNVLMMGALVVGTIWPNRTDLPSATAGDLQDV